jgi:hypothetical protein
VARYYKQYGEFRFQFMYVFIVQMQYVEKRLVLRWHQDDYTNQQIKRCNGIAIVLQDSVKQNLQSTIPWLNPLHCVSLTDYVTIQVIK